ncbi:MAG: diguanylate cyclase [Pseudomonadota bacterium]
MSLHFSSAEGAALHGLLEETIGDIVVQIDTQGFLETASSNITELGYDLTQLLLKPNLADLADKAFGEALREYIALVLSGGPEESAVVDWLEFPLVQGSTHQESETASRKARWYALSLRAISDERGEICGALGLLRSLERQRALEGEIHTRTLTDPMTGLANRRTIRAALGRHLEAQGDGVMALFEIDRIRAVFLQYGQRTVDEIVWSFAKFLETMGEDSFEIGQFDGGRFCVLLPSLSGRESRKWAKQTLQTYAGLTLTPTSRGPRLSASVGLAPIEKSVDWTLKQAEVALVMARAKGGMQVAGCGDVSLGSGRAAL